MEERGGDADLGEGGGGRGAPGELAGSLLGGQGGGNVTLKTGILPPAQFEHRS